MNYKEHVCKFYIKNYIILITLIMASIAQASESRVRDNKVEFAKSIVNGVICWTDSEKVDIVALFNQFSTTSPVNVQDLTPSNFEISLSTSGVQFTGYTDFLKCVNEKSYLQDRLDDISPSTERKNRRTIDYLKVENGKR